MYKSVSYIDKLDRKSGFQKSGSDMKTVYEYQDIDGIQTLVPVGEENIQEEIESYAKSCDIQNILTRFMNGEVDLLNAQPGFYGDVRNMPKTYADYYARVKDAEKIFNDLPYEVKEAFNNSAEQFFTEFGTEEYMKKISSFQPAEKGNSTSGSASGIESEGSDDAK